MVLKPKRSPNRLNALLPEYVFAHLVEAIIEGRIAEGERIRDAEVAKELDVSRAPVREALQRLERIGMVEVSPSRYTRVTHITGTAVGEALEYAGYQAGVVTRMAVARMSPAGKLTAADLVDALERALPDPRASSNARNALYSYLSTQTRNRLQHKMMSESAYALERTLRHVPLPAERLDTITRNYRALREAILNGDEEYAERLVREQHGLV